MPRFFRVIFTWLFIGLLSACAVQESDLSGLAELDDVPMDPIEREAYLRNFPLLNVAGEEKAPIDPVTGSSPFGVLLRLPKKGKVGACTVSHARPGKIVTNAHCVPGHDRMGPGAFYLVFYDKTGRKLHVPVEGFDYVGKRRTDDVAILSISPDAASRWDTVKGNIANRNGAQFVSVWAFDPFEAYSDLRVRHQRTGMVFAPRQCLASRRLPKVEGVRENGEKVNVLKDTDAKEALHNFIDGCNRPLTFGNSGSLITGESRLSEMLGVYHWGVAPTEGAIAQFSRFEYTGNDGQLRQLPSPPPGDLFGVGFALINLANRL